MDQTKQRFIKAFADSLDQTKLGKVTWASQSVEEKVVEADGRVKVRVKRDSDGRPPGNVGGKKAAFGPKVGQGTRRARTGEAAWRVMGGAFLDIDPASPEWDVG